jgi:hypothetical protein
MGRSLRSRTPAAKHRRQNNDPPSLDATGTGTHPISVLLAAKGWCRWLPAPPP